MTTLLRLFGCTWLILGTLVIASMSLAYSDEGPSGLLLLLATIIIGPGILALLTAIAVDRHPLRQYQRAMGLRMPQRSYRA